MRLCNERIRLTQSSYGIFTVLLNIIYKIFHKKYNTLLIIILLQSKFILQLDSYHNNQHQQHTACALQTRQTLLYFHTIINNTAAFCLLSSVPGQTDYTKRNNKNKNNKKKQNRCGFISQAKIQQDSRCFCVCRAMRSKNKLLLEQQCAPRTSRVIGRWSETGQNKL